MKLTIKKPIDFEAKYLKVDAGVRYWNDARVNGVEDTDCEETESAPTIPCAEHVGDQPSVLRGSSWRWRPIINIDEGRIVNWKQGVKAEVHYKVCDDFACEILDPNKDVIASYDGYIPKVMCPADDGYGDYIIMNVDENGFIQGWNKERMRKLIIEIEED